MLRLPMPVAGCLALSLAVLTSSSASAQLLYDTGSPTGFFTPFTSSSPAGIKYGDSGWFGNGGSAPATVREVTLLLCTFSNSPVAAGTADIKFTFNNGDPSGLVFGPGTTLYSTTIPNVALPATDGSNPSYFYLTVPMSGVSTTGGFNNFGWSVGVDNFSFAGSLGFGNRGDYNLLGFYTNNASYYNGSSWSLFAFGANDPADIGNFVVTLAVPEPTSLFALGGVGLAMLRRRVRV